jgi:acyl-CoA synthetase (AMP-forming)/AMP-acid ligase II
MSEFADYLQRVEQPPVSLPGCPLMHGTGIWLGSFLPMLLGGTVVTTSKLGMDPGSTAGHGGGISGDRPRYSG